MASHSVPDENVTLVSLSDPDSSSDSEHDITDVESDSDGSDHGWDMMTSDESVSSESELEEEEVEELHARLINWIALLQRKLANRDLVVVSDPETDSDDE